MDPKFSLQDVLRCHLCENPMPKMFCDICQLNICDHCVGAHLVDESKNHKVVPFRKRIYKPRCQKHSFEQCELHCEPCDIPLCFQCVSSGEHDQHKKVDVLIHFENKKKKSVSQTNVQHPETSTFTDQERKLNFVVLGVAVPIVVVFSVVPQIVRRLMNL